MPNDDISIALQEPENNRRNAFVYNSEYEEENDAGLNTISGQLRNSIRDTARFNKPRTINDRDLRRRDASARRSSSREDSQQKNRKVTFDLPQDV